MADYTIRFTTTGGITQNPVTFTIPEKKGTYSLYFDTSDRKGFYASGNITVDESSHRYNLQFTLSNGTKLNAGYFTTPAIDYLLQKITAIFPIIDVDSKINEQYQPDYENIDAEAANRGVEITLQQVDGEGEVLGQISDQRDDNVICVFSFNYFMTSSVLDFIPSCARAANNNLFFISKLFGDFDLSPAQAGWQVDVDLLTQKVFEIGFDTGTEYYITYFQRDSLYGEIAQKFIDAGYSIVSYVLPIVDNEQLYQQSLVLDVFNQYFAEGHSPDIIFISYKDFIICRDYGAFDPSSSDTTYIIYDAYSPDGDYSNLYLPNGNGTIMCTYPTVDMAALFDAMDFFMENGYVDVSDYQVIYLEDWFTP